MNDLIGTRRLSVVETLEQARQALHTHRSWMKRRVSIAPDQKGKLADTEAQDYTVNMDIFTSRSGQSTLEEEVFSPAGEVIKQQDQAAPPPFAAVTGNLPGLPVGKGTPFTLTEVPSHFYGTQTTEEQELSKDVSRKSISAGSGGRGNKMVESSTQKRRTYVTASKSRVVPVVPVTGPSNHDTDEVTSTPTTATRVFYSKSAELRTPTQNGWTDKPIAENVANSSMISSETEVDSHMDATMNSDLSQIQADTLLIEGGGLILPVSPAPKEQRSSYFAHTQSKIRTVEESLATFSQESEEVLHSPSPSTFRLPINKMGTPKTVEPIEVGETFLQRVLPKSVQETAVTYQQLPMTTASMDDLITVVEPEDIETVDLFSAASAKTTTVENDRPKSKSRVKTSPTVEDTLSLPPARKAVDDTNTLAASTQEPLKGQTRPTRDNTVQLPQSLPSAMREGGGGGGGGPGGGGPGGPGGGGGGVLRDLKLPPLIETTSIGKNISYCLLSCVR